MHISRVLRQSRLLATLMVVALVTLACNANSFEAPTATSTVTPTAIPATVPPETSPPVISPPIEPRKTGVHLLLDDGEKVWSVTKWRSHMEKARQAVGRWGYVTQLVRLDSFPYAIWQDFWELTANYQLTPIIRLATRFDHNTGVWEAPQADPDGSYRTIAAQYAAFVQGGGWPTDAHYVIVGNEPNHGSEWGGVPDPAAYARFLIDVADAIHAADPKAVVLNAPLDPFSPHTNGIPFNDGFIYMDQESFMDGMVVAYPDVFQHIDAWGSHSYPEGPFAEGPWVQNYRLSLINGVVNPAHVEPPPGVYNRGINGYEWELFKLSTYGINNLPVFITETGWRHAETTDPNTSDGGGSYPQVGTVGIYFDLAYNGNNGRYPEMPQEGWTPWLLDPRVQAVTPFALDGIASKWGHTTWLVVDEQGDISGQYPFFDLFMSMAGDR